jgi:hypothetical protein
VNPDFGEGFVDWDWIAAQPAAAEMRFVRRLEFAAPIVVKMNGRKNMGLIYKPGAAPSVDGSEAA